MELNGEAQQLVAEFQDCVGLGQVDAYRSAFAVLALRKGWSKARIARYLGVSRARIGQKVVKFKRYAGEHADDMPTLSQLLRESEAAAERDSNVAVSFPFEKWEDPKFAVELLNRISREPSRDS